MKKLQLIAALFLVMVTVSCSSTNHTGSSGSDDVYYSSKDVNQTQTQPTTPPQSPSTYSTSTNNDQQGNSGNSSQENTNNQQDYNDNSNPSTSQQNQGYSNSNESRDGNGNTYITNNYYNDDYYDYSYSARLRRFYTPVYGYNYYDPYYTNLYWYDYNPYSWGISIYLGYHWWAPPYYYNDPFCYGGFYRPYDPWYSPYYGGYGHGYYPGYYGYTDGYYNNPYYYNSYDGTSHYYGPRGSISGNGGRASSGSVSGTNTGGRGERLATLGEKYQEAIADGRISKTPVNIGKTNLDNKTGILNTESGKNNSIPKSENSSGIKDGHISNQASPSLGGTKSNPTNSYNQQTGTPAKGIITNKNESGMPGNNHQDNSKTFSKPVRSNETSPTNNMNGKSNQTHSQPVYGQPGTRSNNVPANPNNTSRPQQNNSGNPKTETPRNYQNNNVQPRQQNESRPVEVPKNNDRPRNDNSQPSRQNNEPRHPRQMSNAETPHYNAPEINRPSQSNSSQGRSEGNYSTGGNRSTNNGGSRGRR